MLLNAVKSLIPKSFLDLPLQKVATYAFVTTARSHRLGTSMTILDDRIFQSGEHRPIRSLGEVEKLTIREILPWTDSCHPIERSIGMAALNSCVPLDYKWYATGNALDLTARLGKGKNVVVVGHFPDMERIRETARSFKILEKRPQPGDLPAEDAPRVIPEADVVAMTGVTCLNDTLEGLLALKKPGSIFIVLGPTVPLSTALFDAGVDVIGGAWVEDEDRVISMLAQGGTARVIDGMRCVLMPKNPALVSGFPLVSPPIAAAT